MKSLLPCNNIDVHEHFTEIAMPFDTSCSGLPCPWCVSTTEKQGICLWNCLIKVHSELYAGTKVNLVKIAQVKRKKNRNCNKFIFLLHHKKERNMRRMKKQIFFLVCFTSECLHKSK